MLNVINQDKFPRFNFSLDTKFISMSKQANILSFVHNFMYNKSSISLSGIYPFAHTFQYLCDHITYKTLKPLTG